jgi:hypothetical protein
MGTFAQKVSFDGVGSDKNVGGFGVEMVFGRSQESEAFFGDFQVAGAKICCGWGRRIIITHSHCAARVVFTHNYCAVERVSSRRTPKNYCRIKNFWRTDALSRHSGQTFNEATNRAKVTAKQQLFFRKFIAAKCKAAMKNLFGRNRQPPTSALASAASGVLK